MKISLLINCSNLHGGGSAAVATSFIFAASKMKPADMVISLLVSRFVYENLEGLGADLSGFDSVDVVDFFGVEALYKGLGERIIGYDVVFTVFGPAYYLNRLQGKHVIGFAQPAIVYPDRINLFEKSLLRRLFLKAKYSLQELFFFKADLLVVELEHVLRGLRNNRVLARKPMVIINSTVDDIYHDACRWAALDIGDVGGEGVLKLGLISNNYPHKNISVFPDVKKILREKYGIVADFYVTFSRADWQDCPDSFKSSVKNLGTIKLAQCPAFYQAMDAIVFPTLLECFSAVPVESMIMRTPLYASDLPFIRDCCGDYAGYFDPLDPESIAHAIYVGINNGVNLDDAYKHALSFGDSSRRATQYIEAIRSIFNS